MPNKHVRLANLRQLIKREGAVSQLALRLQISPIYIYRVLDGKFNIGDSMARKIEDSYGFPPHWMDAAHEDDEEAQAHIPTLETIEHERALAPRRDERRPAVLLSDAVPLPATAEAPVRSAPVLTPAAAVFPAAAPTPSTPVHEAKPTSAVSPPERTIEEDPRQRIVATLVNTLDRLLVSYNLDLSDLEKARILMKAAEAVLDSSNASRAPGASPKSVVKIS